MLINSYKDLKVWQLSHEVAINVFRLFKKEKRDPFTYVIWKQTLRAVFSVPANIVEGFYSHKGLNYASKLNVAKGEAGESDYWLFVLWEIGLITKQEYENLSGKLIEVIKMLSAIRKKLNK